MRAKRVSPVTGSRTRSPRLSERPEMYGKGSPGPDRQRREHRVDLAVERSLTARRSAALQVGVAGRPRCRPRRARAAAPRARCGSARRSARRTRSAMRSSTSLAAELVGRRRQAARLERVLHRRHAHHEELVQVAREDREELAALEQGHARVAGERQDAGVEVEPRELAVDVERRVGELRGRREPRERWSWTAHSGPSNPRRKGVDRLGHGVRSTVSV